MVRAGTRRSGERGTRDRRRSGPSSASTRRLFSPTVASRPIVESLPVKSLVTSPRSGHVHQLGSDLEVRGHARAGDLAATRVDVSIDFGQTWERRDWGAPLPPPHQGGPPGRLPQVGQTAGRFENRIQGALVPDRGVLISQNGERLGMVLLRWLGVGLASQLHGEAFFATL